MTENSEKNNGKCKGRPENLTPWKPGESGNPGGRPRLKPISDRLHRILDDPKEADAIVQALVKSAKKGSIRHLQEIIDRTEGKVAQALQLHAEKTYVLSDSDREAARLIIDRLKSNEH